MAAPLLMGGRRYHTPLPLLMMELHGKVVLDPTQRAPRIIRSGPAFAVGGGAVTQAAAGLRLGTVTESLSAFREGHWGSIISILPFLLENSNIFTRKN